MNTLSLIFLAVAVVSLVAGGFFFFMLQHTFSRIKSVSTDNSNYENIIQQANDALCVIDIVDGRIYTANPKLSELLGYPHEKLLKLSVFDLHPKEMLNKSSEVIADVWEKKGLIYTDLPFVTSSGEILPVECSAKVIPYNGRPAILIYSRDIRERLRMEKEIREKSAIVEQKNKDITDSINYARRIQEAILSPKTEKHRLFPNSFVLYRPRDIVSGDFYWFTEKNGRRLIAAVDCTGHGVPGAFMSMIGNAFLNGIVNEKGITKPSEILNQLREMVIKSLKQSATESESKDGMDIALLSCKIEEGKWLIEYAGANNPLWICRMEEGTWQMEEVPADKQPIGIHGAETTPFTHHSIQVKKGDVVYIFTDGYADQFGGPRGKKFKYKQLQEALLSIQDKKMNEQEEFLLKTMNDWKGDLEQVDDILVIGVRV